MTFNPSIPAAGTKIRNTFNLIQKNFAQLNLLYGSDTSSNGKDHVEFDNATTANRGLHKQVTFIDNRLTGAGTDPALSNPQSMLYTKDRTVGADTYRSLFFSQKPNTAAQINQALTWLPHTDFAGAFGSYRVYDTPWGWRFHIGTTAAGGSTNINPLGVPLLANGMFAGGASTGAANAVGISLASSTNITISCATNCRWMIISTNM